MELNQGANKKIEELQSLEAKIQNFLAQKQTAEIELNEINNAIQEIKNTDDEVYKIISGIMIKSDKKKLNSELEEKKKMLELKINVLEKQEKLLEKDSSSLRKEVKKSMNSPPELLDASNFRKSENCGTEICKNPEQISCAQSAPRTKASRTTVLDGRQEREQ